MKKFYLMIFAIVTLAGMLAISGCGKERVYRVTFDANGGTGVMKEQTFAKDVSQALISNAFTREGYAFTGWNTIADGTGVSYSDSQEIVLTDDVTLYAQWNALTGQKNGHEYIDLGLPSGLLWATCNVGSTTPEGYGDYFAWGETAPKDTYSWSTYNYYDGSSVTKYTSSDNLTILEASDDAATANWGAGWRMPTADEMRELQDYCVVIWKEQNGVNGRLFTGPNGNSIFLPAAGYRYDSDLNDAGSDGNYWSSSLSTGYPSYAWYLYFDSDDCSMDYGSRYYGQSVRPVCVSQN